MPPDNAAPAAPSAAPAAPSAAPSVTPAATPAAATVLSESQGVELLTKMRTDRQAPPAAVQAETVTPQQSTTEEVPQVVTDEDLISDETPETQTEDEVPREDDHQVAFTLDDGTPVTIGEARQSYLGRQELEARTTTLTNIQQTAEQRIQIVDQAAEFYAARLPMMIEHIKSMTPPPPDESLRATDPGRYWDQYNDRIVKERRVQQLEGEIVQAQQLRQQAAAMKHQESMLDEWNKLVDKLPSWRNPKIATKEQGAIAEYGKAAGFSEQELAGIDHRSVIVFRDAVLGAKVRANNARNAMKPGSVTGPNPTVSVKQTEGINANQPAGSGSGSQAPKVSPKIDPTAPARQRFDQGVAALQARRGNGVQPPRR